MTEVSRLDLAEVRAKVNILAVVIAQTLAELHPNGEAVRVFLAKLEDMRAECENGGEGLDDVEAMLRAVRHFFPY